MKACLDIPGDIEGGRIVEAEDWLTINLRPYRGQILAALARGETWRAASGAWSLTPLDQGRHTQAFGRKNDGRNA